MTAPVLCARCGAEQRTDVQVLCVDCTGTLRSDLRGALSVLGLLRDVLARRDRIDRPSGNDDDVRRTLDARYPLTAAATPSPASLGASDVAHDVREVVRYWATRLVDDAAPPLLPFCSHPTCVDHRDAAGRAVLVDDVIGPVCEQSHDASERVERRLRFLHGIGLDSARWLADRVDLVRRQPWAGTCAADVARVTARAWALVDRPPDTWFAGTCDVQLPDPDMPGTTYLCGWQLDARLDEVTVRCRGCGTVHDVEQRRARMLERMPDVLVTAADAARALSTPGRPVTAAMVRGWRHRGHLQPEHGPDGQPLYDDRGAPLYRLAAVQAADTLVRYGDPNRTRGPRAS